MEEEEEDSDSEYNTDNEYSGPGTASKKKKRKVSYKQTYKTDWENNPLFKPWLSRCDMEPTAAYCKFCQVKLVSKKCVLNLHANSEKHKTAALARNSTPSVETFFKKDSVKSATQRAEIKLCVALAEHNIPFRAMDHLSQVISDCFPDSEIARNMKCKRTKSANVVYNVLAPEIKKEVISSIQKRQCFSMIIDEATDISTCKSLAIVAKSYNNDQKKIQTKLLGLVEAASGSSEDLFTAIDNKLKESGLKWSDMIGFAADTTNVMFGEHNSVAQRIKQASPHCITIKCVCHSSALAVAAACKKLPRSLEDLVSDVHNYFASSSKRKKSFSEFQKFFGTKPHAMLKHYDIRWLSLFACVSRILEQWEPLKQYFTVEYLQDRVLASERAFNALNDRVCKVYFHFMNFILPLTNKFNEMFQAAYSSVFRLVSEASLLFQTICSYFLNMDYVKNSPVHALNPALEFNFLPLRNMNIGFQARQFLLSGDMHEPVVKEILLRCREFYVELCCQLKMRLPFDIAVLRHIHILDKANIMKAEQHEMMSLLQCLQSVTNEEKQLIHSQYTEMMFDKHVDNLVTSCETTEEFWGKVGEVKGTDPQSMNIFQT